MYFVTSDIHSNKIAFDKIVKKLDFKKDQLYINGDVIDRGNDGFKILDEIMANNNIHLILGNHEVAMMNVYFAKKNNDKEKEENWTNYWFEGGGRKSYNYFFNELDDAKRDEYIKFLLTCSYEELLKVKGKYFYIVHACPSNNVLTKVTDRSEIYDIINFNLDIIIEQTQNGLNITYAKLYPEDIQLLLQDEERDYIVNPFVIVGHNPTKYFQSDKIGKIFRKNNILNIDCGSNGYNYEFDKDGFKGRLALLCLNTMQVEYF